MSAGPPERGPVDAPVHEPPRPNEAGADGEMLRAAMRHLASPVTVVTAAAGGERRGVTIGSFTSVSLEPPLVGFYVMRGTTFHGLIRRSERFAVHLLHERQADLAEHFAQPDLTGAEQFADIPLRSEEEASLPVLQDAACILRCERWAVREAGDHDLVLGQVLQVEGEMSGVGPLLYFARSYRAVGREV